MKGVISGIQAGSIGTIAGSGSPGFEGDGGPAGRARLNEPKSVAVVETMLYIADAENHRIRLVNLSTGIIRTVAGSDSDAGTPQPSVAPLEQAEEEDPFAEPAKPVTFTQVPDLSGTVRYVVGQATGGGGFGGDGGPATAARLNFPSAVALDADGTVYIADTMNHRVRQVTPRGIITTVAGTGQARYGGDGGPAALAALNEPAALVVHAGRLYVADQSNNRVRAIDLLSREISTVAGTGEAGYNGDGMPATQASLAGPSGLAIDREGILLIADTFNGRIRAVDLATGTIRTLIGDGGEYRYQAPREFSTSLSRPYGIAIQAGGDVLITDSDSHLIRRWDRTRKIITVLAGSGRADYGGDGGAPLSSSLNYPFGVAVDGAGNVYIADTFNHRIRMIAAA